MKNKVKLNGYLEIKNAVDSGKTVHSSNDGYVVIRDAYGYLIKFLGNNYCIGLHAMNDVEKLNGSDFYYYE